MFTIRLFLKSQHKNLAGLFADIKHSMFVTFLAIFEKHPENLQGLWCLGSRKICLIPILLNNNQRSFIFLSLFSTFHFVILCLYPDLSG